MIKETTIDQVREADIIKVIGSYCELKKAGSNYTCRSPFTEDKTASFMVNPVKNTWFCYSSNQGGDAIEFVKIRENCTFIEAVEKVAGICSILIEHEALTEHQQLKRNEREKQLGVMQATAKEYKAQLQKLPANHWAKVMVGMRNINQESILNFGIGYAPGDRLVTKSLTEKALYDVGVQAGLIAVKDGRNFDFFNDRLMFPIQNAKGEVIGFGGRQSGTLEHSPKYLNSKESDIYSKTSTIYGLYQAKNVINKTKQAVLMEGYTDVIAAHQNGVDTAIATCGTALTDKQADQISRYARTVVICRDNDVPGTFKDFIAEGKNIIKKYNLKFDLQSKNVTEFFNDVKETHSELLNTAEFELLEKTYKKIDHTELGPGTRAAIKDINILLSAGLRVLICHLPEGEDPDSFSQKNNLKKYIEDKSTDAVTWKTTLLKNRAADDAYKMPEVFKEVADMLFAIKDDYIRKDFTKNLSKVLKISEKELRGYVEDIQERIEEEAKSKLKVTDSELKQLNLPKGADYQEFMQHRYCTVGNSYWFRGREGNFFKGTNFRVTPIFHIGGKKNNQRICEIVNEDGIKRILAINSDDFVAKTTFEKIVFREDNFVFTENASANHYSLFRNRMSKEFVKANEVFTLGWNEKHHFFAFADSIYYKGNVKRINPYGVIELDIPVEDENQSEFHTQSNHYYLPAFSEINKYNDDDDDEYENDRYLTYSQSPVTFYQWADQMLKVYGFEKGCTGVCFNMASLFRNVFMKRYEAFPLVFMTGEKGSGKTKYGLSLTNMFTTKQIPFDLNTASLPAFGRRLARFNNVPNFFEEFNDAIDDNMFQGIKGAFDGRGRELAKYNDAKRTTNVKVKTPLIIASQYLSVKDDNSITSRSILMHFIKPKEAFTIDQMREFNTLKSWEEKGLSSLITDLLIHYDHVVKNIDSTYSDLIKKIKNDLKGRDYQERMMQNYMILLTPFKIYEEVMNLPFKWQDAYDHFKNMILESSDLIVESEGLAEFWRVLEFLLDRSFIKAGDHFKIDPKLSVKFQTRKGEPDAVWTNKDNKRLLFLRLNAVHQLYHKEVSMREGVDVISEGTMRNYFKSKKYFLGVVGSERFGKISTSAIVFDYDAMMNGGILNLDRFEEHEPDPTKDANGNAIDSAKNGPVIPQEMKPIQHQMELNGEPGDDTPF